MSTGRRPDQDSEGLGPRGPRGLCVAVTAGLKQTVTYADFNKTVCVQVSDVRSVGTLQWFRHETG